MAIKYVRSGATGAGDGSSWANAYTTFGAAVAAVAAGDDIYVSEDHNETQAAAQTYTLPGTFTSPNRILCANHTGAQPPVAADLTTGALVQCNLAITLNGVFYSRGVSFVCGVGSAGGVTFSLANTTGNFQTFELTNFKIAATGSSALIGFNIPSTKLVLLNSTMEFSHAGQGVRNGCVFNWINKTNAAAIQGTPLTTSLFRGPTSGGYCPTVLDGLDLSSFAAPLHSANATMRGAISLIGCKLNAGFSVPSPADVGSLGINLIGCNSTGNVERNERYLAQGTLTTELTIKRSAGASDGTTPYSWKVVTNALASLVFPFDTFEGVAWNASVGSLKTLTVHIVTDNISLKDNEIWVEVESLTDAGSPIITLASDGAANILSAGAAQASDSAEPWTTTGLVTPLKQKLSVTFTPQIVGPIRWRVKVAKPSITVYVDPLADIA